MNTPDGGFKPGPALREFLATELMGWEPTNETVGHWIRPFDDEGRAVVVCTGCDIVGGCQGLVNPPVKWLPDRDPTTAVRDIIPAMRELGWALTLEQRFYDGAWRAIFDYLGPIGDDEHVRSRSSRTFHVDLAGAVCLTAAKALGDGESAG